MITEFGTFNDIEAAWYGCDFGVKQSNIVVAGCELGDVGYIV